MIDLKAVAGDRYRITLDESAKLDTERANRIWYYRIPCKYGHISVHGENMLAAWTGSRNMISKPAALPGVRVHQRGDREIAVTFEPKRLDAVAELLHARKKRKMSEEQKARLRAISPFSGKSFPSQEATKQG